jgi:hypothetical protein
LLSIQLVPLRHGSMRVVMEDSNTGEEIERRCPWQGGKR